MLMASYQIQYRPSEQQYQALQERSEMGKSPSLTASEMVDAYLSLLRRSLPTFTENEAMLMMDAMNGCLIDYHAPTTLWANIADAVSIDRVDQKWQVDGYALVERLRKLTPFEQWAIYDAIRRAWNSETYRIDNMAERIRKVGLVKE